MKAVFFDIGATLVRGPDISPAKQVAKLLGLSEEDAQRAVDLLMTREFACPQEACAALSELFPLSKEQKEILLALWAEQERAAQALPGALEAVRRARELGFVVALISDIWVPYFKGFLYACPEIAALIDFCSLSFRVGRRKPAKELFKVALEALGTEPSCTVMVGDTFEKDIMPALDMGMAAIWVLCRPEREWEAMARVLLGVYPRPHSIVPDITGVPQALEEISLLLREK